MSEQATHKCPIDGCEVQLPRHILMCRDHWQQVPSLTQTRVNVAWRRNNALEYWAARKAAIAAVNDKQVRNGDTGN